MTTVTTLSIEELVSEDSPAAGALRRRGLDIGRSLCNTSDVDDAERRFLDNLQHWSSLGVGRSIAAERIGEAFQSKSEVLNLDDLRLTGLPDFLQELVSVKYLSVDGNRLKQLPTLPPNLLQLTAVTNILESIPELPPKLEGLYLGNNKLTCLPSLPSALTVLSALNNDLVELPALPRSIVSIHVHFNALSRLPALPEGLEHLFINNNRISLLPALPTSLKKLAFDSNPLNVLPILPDLSKSARGT